MTQKIWFAYRDDGDDWLTPIAAFASESDALTMSDDVGEIDFYDQPLGREIVYRIVVLLNDRGETVDCAERKVERREFDDRFGQTDVMTTIMDFRSINRPYTVAFNVTSEGIDADAVRSESNLAVQGLLVRLERWS